MPPNVARREALGPAERTIALLTTWTDHLVHHRPGVVSPAPGTATGVLWRPAVARSEGVFVQIKEGRKHKTVRLGDLGSDRRVRDAGRVVGEYRAPGLYPEVAAWMYRQIADLWRLDNEFVARFASWAFPREHRDLKVLLAALLLVQSRSGEPVRGSDGAILFRDEDYREVGEAMCLIRRPDKRDLNPKLLLRVGELLSLPQIAAVNRELGFGRSARSPALGRWPKAVERWLRHREGNPVMLQGLVRAGFRTTVMKLAKRIGYKPDSERFFEILRWKQKQAPDGRRSLAIGRELAPAASWQGLSVSEILEQIASTRPSWKRLVGLLPAEPGLTKEIALAAIEAGAMSDTDLILATPSLEELGLLGIEPVASRWRSATERVEGLRAANIALRVRDPGASAALAEASDRSLQRSLQEVTDNLRIYVFVDRSASMQGAIDRAKVYLARLLQGFSLERLHVATFAVKGTEIHIEAPTAEAVERAFASERAFGGTAYGAGIRALQHHRPKPGEDVLFLFVGDQEDGHGVFETAVRKSELSPVAFGLLEVKGPEKARPYWTMRPKGGWRAVEVTAERLGLPCFRIDEQMFSDSYGVTRVLRELIATTPVRARAAKTDLVGEILGTTLLQRPSWAQVARPHSEG